MTNNFEVAKAISATGMSECRLIDVIAVAQKLGCDKRTVYRLASSRLMPFGMKLGTLRRWNEAELDSWIAGGCKAITPSVEGQV